jgi:hypothetical protein
LSPGTNAQEVDALDGLPQRVALKRLGQPFDAEIFRIREQFDGAVIHAFQKQDFSPLIGL